MEMFYKDLLAWIKDGQKPHAVFSRHRALCSTVFRYTENEEPNLADAFEEAGLNRGTPFNEDSASWNLECRNGTVYQNPSRLHWIKYHAMSPKLAAFYRDMDTWVKTGAQGREFKRYFGLCENLLRQYEESHTQEREGLISELEEQFTDARLDTDYPFNQNREEFLHDSHKELLYLNRARVTWVQRFSDPVLQNSPWLVGQPL